MQKKYLLTIAGILILASPALFGAAGRPSDGWLSFIIVLGFLGTILGILYIIDLIRTLLRRMLHKNGEETLI